MVVGVALALLLVVMMQALPRPAYAASDRLPDLGMERLQNLRIRNCTDTSQRDCQFVGQRQLRFDGIIVNVGAGAFEVQGSNRDSTGVLTKVTQHIFDDQGGYRSVDTKVGNDGSTAQMYFAGDGHNHWHLRDLAEYELIPLPVENNGRVRTGEKRGFCFFDNYPFGSTQDRFYTSCGRNRDAQIRRMGISRGWGDRYGSSTFGQYIDITDASSGRYELRATADKHNWFLESDENNNFTWVEIQISGKSVSVIAYGPAARPI